MIHTLHSFVHIANHTSCHICCYRQLHHALVNKARRGEKQEEEGRKEQIVYWWSRPTRTVYQFIWASVGHAPPKFLRILSSVDDRGLPWIPWMMGKENLPSVRSSQKLLFSVYCSKIWCNHDIINCDQSTWWTNGGVLMVLAQRREDVI